MQSSPFEGDESSEPSAAREARRLLEDPHRIRGETDQDIFSQFGHVGRLVNQRTASYRRIEELAWYQREYQSLEFTHKASLLRLEGASIQELLGGVVLLSFKERPVHHPRPGLDDVLVAIIDKNPMLMSMQEIFFTIHEETLRKS